MCYYEKDEDVINVQKVPFVFETIFKDNLCYFML